MDEDSIGISPTEMEAGVLLLRSWVVSSVWHVIQFSASLVGPVYFQLVSLAYLDCKLLKSMMCVLCYSQP